MFGCHAFKIRPGVGRRGCVVPSGPPAPSPQTPFITIESDLLVCMRRKDSFRLLCSQRMFFSKVLKHYDYHFGSVFQFWGGMSVLLRELGYEHLYFTPTINYCSSRGKGTSGQRIQGFKRNSKLDCQIVFLVRGGFPVWGCSQAMRPNWLVFIHNTFNNFLQNIMIFRSFNPFLFCS